MLDSVEVLGDRHPGTLSSRANLGTSYLSAGRTSEAIKLLEQVLQERVELLGDRHPDTLSSRANLASSYLSTGRTSEAITLLKQAVEVAEALVLHPNLASWKAALAQLLGEERT